MPRTGCYHRCYWSCRRRPRCCCWSSCRRPRCCWSRLLPSNQPSTRRCRRRRCTACGRQTRSCSSTHTAVVPIRTPLQGKNRPSRTRARQQTWVRRARPRLRSPIRSIRRPSEARRTGSGQEPSSFACRAAKHRPCHSLRLPQARKNKVHASVRGVCTSRKLRCVTPRWLRCGAPRPQQLRPRHSASDQLR